MKLLKQIFCFHPRLKCEEYSEFNFEPDTRVRYLSALSLWQTKETRYLCGKCKKKFWYCKGDMEHQKANESFIDSMQSYNSLKETR
jgi:hypothetical protein